MDETPIPLELIDEDDPDEIRLKLDPVKLASRVAGIRETGRPWAPIFVFRKGERYGRVGGKYRTTAYRVLLDETKDQRWRTIPAYVLTGDQLDLDIMRLADNAARETNTTFEVARHVHRLKRTHQISTPALLARFGKVGLDYSASYLDSLVRLQENLAPQVLDHWRDQAPFATMPRLTRLLELGSSPEGKAAQAALVQRFMEGGYQSDWIDAQLDAAKRPKRRGPQTEGTRMLFVRDQIEKSRMEPRIKRATLALIDVLRDNQVETITLGGVVIECRRKPKTQPGPSKKL